MNAPESARPAPSAPPSLYRALPDRGEGGKLVAVFPGSGDEQARAAAVGAPLSVFVQSADPTGVQLRVFTPTREKGSSDSAAIAALSALRVPVGLLDVVEVTQGDPEAGGEVQSAQLCGGEWVLRQGLAVAGAVSADLSPIGLGGLGAWTGSTGRPNLVAELPTLAALDAFEPDDEAIRMVNRATDTTGLVLYTLGGPGRVDVSFRAFGPLKGFSEDAASSNMLACLVGVLGLRVQLPADVNLLRAAQRRPGQPARLSAQFASLQGGVEVWVGGTATPEEPAGSPGVPRRA
ncbi:PhzF family phenazine biosynthesis protein [Deinococcus radiotolerans]|uniref:Phenazine biosynthesis PhzC/PhzF protein n=1 Tax=Deinococcus radiotolerans TaxID=1309407 RepID=A0ABQ2FI50_9DEIO|nr:PhzF family phenazine biosynthesis protein [Deinococcus radiotolerans]GGK91707.1 hypothetical protein GCM10010844_07770 [Deinococcus radiotolerans]